MTSTVLPYQKKLSGSYTKQVAFNNTTCKPHNQYIRKMGKGLSSIEVEYSLKYVGLTAVEQAEVELLFGTQHVEDWITWKAPIDAFAGNYYKPTQWETEIIYVITGAAGNYVRTPLTNLTFKLRGFVAKASLDAFVASWGDLLLVDDVGFIDFTLVDFGYLQAFNNDTLPYTANGLNYDVFLYDGVTTAKTITVVNEGTWQIDNYGGVSLTTVPALSTNPTPIQYVLWDRWSRKSNYATITFTAPVLSPSSFSLVWQPFVLAVTPTEIWAGAAGDLATSQKFIYKVNKVTKALSTFNILNALGNPINGVVSDVKSNSQFIYVLVSYATSGATDVGIYRYNFSGGLESFTQLSADDWHVMMQVSEDAVYTLATSPAGTYGHQVRKYSISGTAIAAITVPNPDYYALNNDLYTKTGLTITESALYVNLQNDWWQVKTFWSDLNLSAMTEMAYLVAGVDTSYYDRPLALKQVEEAAVLSNKGYFNRNSDNTLRYKLEGTSTVVTGLNYSMPGYILTNTQMYFSKLFNKVIFAADFGTFTGGSTVYVCNKTTLVSSFSANTNHYPTPAVDDPYDNCIWVGSYNLYIGEVGLFRYGI